MGGPGVQPLVLGGVCPPLRVFSSFSPGQGGSRPPLRVAPGQLLVAWPEPCPTAQCVSGEKPASPPQGQVRAGLTPLGLSPSGPLGSRMGKRCPQASHQPLASIQPQWLCCTRTLPWLLWGGIVWPYRGVAPLCPALSPSLGVFPPTALVGDAGASTAFGGSPGQVYSGAGSLLSSFPSTGAHAWSFNCSSSHTAQQGQACTGCCARLCWRGSPPLGTAPHGGASPHWGPARCCLSHGLRVGPCFRGLDDGCVRIHRMLGWGVQGSPPITPPSLPVQGTACGRQRTGRRAARWSGCSC